jgi:hypothetical protein
MALIQLIHFAKKPFMMQNLQNYFMFYLIKGNVSDANQHPCANYANCYQVHRI